MTSRPMQLTHRVTTTPDSSSQLFYVEAGRDFDVRGYAKAHDLELDDLDPADVVAVQAAAAQLIQGEWLRVTHETTGSK